VVVSTVEAGAVDVQHRIELSPNCSLTPASARVFVVSVAGLTFGVALLFAVAGFWPVLPFAALEMMLLCWAVHASMRAGSLREVIVVSDDAVLVERRWLGNTRRLVFARHWATVKLCGPPAARYPRRLVIESHGRACEVGRFLTEDERRGLAARLCELVGRSSESPALDVRSP
jgi:uncharacterized membrane protein